MRIYAIGDIHGQLDMLKAAHKRIEADKVRVGDPDAKIIHLGDYVDRGPDSKGVIQYLMDGMAAGQPWLAIRGNHDRMFTRFVRHGIAHDAQIKSGKSWLHPALGGVETLASYGVEAKDGDFELCHMRAHKGVPAAHLDFIENLPLTHQWGDYLFVHAGIRPGVAVEDQDEEDLIWIREGWLDYHGTLPMMVVHGHTALDEPTHFGNRIDIDSGAGYGHPMTTLVIEHGHEEVVTETGRRPLTHAKPGQAATSHDIAIGNLTASTHDISCVIARICASAQSFPVNFRNLIKTLFTLSGPFYRKAPVEQDRAGFEEVPHVIV